MGEITSVLEQKLWAKFSFAFINSTVFLLFHLKNGELKSSTSILQFPPMTKFMKCRKIFCVITNLHH